MASKLIVEVLAKVQGTKELDSFGSKLSRTGANLTKFVTLPLVGLGAAATAMALDAEKSATKLAAAFKTMGKTSGRSLEQLQDKAEELGQTTIFDDEQVMEAQAALLKFGAVSGEAFDRATLAAADFAAATGKDLTTATDTLGKALADPTAALARLARQGIIFTDAQKEQITALQESGDMVGAQTLILQAFEDRFKSTNETMQNSTAGQAAQAFEDLQNAGEEIGAVFLPILAHLAQGLATVAKFFTDLPAPVQQTIVVLGAVVAAVGPLVFIIGKLAGAFQVVIGVFRLLSLALLANPFVALAAAVVAIAALIILNWDKIFAFLKAVWSKITTALGGVVKFFTDAWTGLVKATTAAWDAVSGIIKGAVNAVIDVINGLFSFLNGISIGIPEVNVGPIHIGGGTIDPFNIPLIPHLAEGGIVDGPTLALIGERGPEAVVPLGSNMPGNEFHSHITVQGRPEFIEDEDDLIRTQQRIAFLAGF